ncbi:MAG: rhodanese-like domain-containing protein [Acidobacteria bacterium]|nr:rhodanese-like domain-containing protein [Acidobacteriota bacterium]
MKRGRPWLDIPGFLLAALLCAWISNHFAGPTRRLAWIQEAPAPVVPAPAIAPMAPSAPMASPPKSAVSEPAVRKIAKAETPAWDPAALLTRFPPIQGQVYGEIGSDDARWLQAHGALFADARRSEVYAEGHIAGARSLPVWEDGLAAKIAALGKAAMGPDLPLVVYCAGGDCEDSKLLAQKLWVAGYRNLRVYTGGYPDWTAQSWPTAKGPEP